MPASRDDLGATLCRLIDDAPVGFLVLEPDWTVLYASRAADSMLAIESHPNADFLSLLMAEFSFSPHDTDLDQGFTLSRGDGADLSCTIVPREPQDRGGRMLVLIQEAHKGGGQTALDEEFLALLSHKLLSPLAAVAANLSVLRAPGLVGSEEERGTIIADAEAAADRLRRVIHQVVAILQDPPADFAPTPAYQTLEILEMQAANVRLRYPGREIVFEIIDRLAGSSVSLSTGELQTIADNLLDNALKFSERAGSAVRVIAEATPASVALSFEDEGPGIEAHDQAQIRHPSSRPAKGPGLGLRVVEKIASARGGLVSLLSTPGRGTTVRVEIPNRASQSKREDHRAPSLSQ